MAGKIYEYKNITTYTYSPESTMSLSLNKLIDLLQPVLPTWRGMTIRQKDGNGPCNFRLLDTPAPKEGEPYHIFDNTIGSLTVSPVPHCCGLCLGSGFSSKPRDVKHLDPMFEWLEYSSWYDLERSQVTYVSADTQVEINEVLRARGYEKVYEFINANTGNSIYNWFKDVEGDPTYYDDDYDYDEDDYYDE